MNPLTSPQIDSAPIDWRARRITVQAHEITESMLLGARRDADDSRLPQTVWPSLYHGRRFLGTDALLVWGAALLCDGRPWTDGRGSTHTARPVDTDPHAVGPLLTVLPRDWFTGGVR